MHGCSGTRAALTEEVVLEQALRGQGGVSHEAWGLQLWASVGRITGSCLALFGLEKQTRGRSGSLQQFPQKIQGHQKSWCDLGTQTTQMAGRRSTEPNRGISRKSQQWALGHYWSQGSREVSCGDPQGPANHPEYCGKAPAWGIDSQRSG